MPPLAGRRPGARRIAGALFELGGDALARGVQVVTGRAKPSAAAALERPADTTARQDEHAGSDVGVEEAAARLDAARERLRAAIPAPEDES